MEPPVAGPYYIPVTPDVRAGPGVEIFPIEENPR